LLGLAPQKFSPGKGADVEPEIIRSWNFTVAVTPGAQPDIKTRYYSGKVIRPDTVYVNVVMAHGGRPALAYWTVTGPLAGIGGFLSRQRLTASAATLEGIPGWVEKITSECVAQAHTEISRIFGEPDYGPS
jgi:hypothetical protein